MSTNIQRYSLAVCGKPSNRAPFLSALLVAVGLLLTGLALFPPTTLTTDSESTVPLLVDGTVDSGGGG